MPLKVRVIEKRRNNLGRAYPEITWKYQIVFGPLKQNVVESRFAYETHANATKAGERQLDNLKKAIKEEDSVLS